MIQTLENNKRVAQNSLFLYFRMLILVCVNLYTSRIVLEVLGVDDFGTYNVVGGIVSMCTVLSGGLSSAISRYLTYELGKGNKENLNRVFSASVTILIFLSLIIFVVMETVGIWFLNLHMEIPAGRIVAANWTLQLSIITFVVNLISVPYNATIIAHEKMAAFAYISIFEAVGKMAIAFLIVLSPIDKLIFYSILMCAVAVTIRFVYGRYCKLHFEECRFRFFYDRILLRKMLGFAGWNFLGTTAYMLNIQGVNILINMFFGVKLNAARAIASQLEAALRQFINGFMMAVNPQITKSYAQEDMDYMYSLICRSARFSSFLLLFLAIPLFLETDILFSIWLKEVPQYAVLFFRLTIFIAFIDGALTNSLMTAVFSTGNIRKYQLIVSLVGGGVFPLSWLFFHWGYPAWITYLIYIVIYMGVLLVRVFSVKQSVGFPINVYINNVLLKVLLVSFLGIIPPYILHQKIDAGFPRLLLVSVCGIVSTSIFVYFVGLTKGERNFIVNKIRQ